MMKKSLVQTFAARLLSGVSVAAVALAASYSSPYAGSGGGGNALPIGGDGAAAQPMRLKGTMEAWLRHPADAEHPHGWTEYFHKDNLIVDVGFDFIADAIGAPSGRPAVMGYIAVGTGTTAAAAGDTALETETLRKAATYSHTAGTKVFQLEATFNAGEATGALTESAVLNAAVAGTMLDRVVFSVINKGADDILTQRFTFTMS